MAQVIVNGAPFGDRQFPERRRHNR
jgi:hypothetical protein